VFDGLFIFLLVFNTDDTDIKLKNKLIHFTRSNSITVNVSAYITPTPQSGLAIRLLPFEFYSQNSVCICHCPVQVSRRPNPQIILRDSMIRMIFCENYELGTSVL